jgi:type 1 glutamine amidotransferase
MTLKSLVLCLAVVACAASCPAANPKVLVFSKTTGFDHGTKTVIDSLVKALGAANGFDVDAGTDAAVFFTDAKLGEYKAVYFNGEGDNVLNDSQKAVLQRYVRKGNGFLGMHGSSDCEYNWPWYGDLLGAWFNGHPYGIQNARVLVVDKKHPSTQFITADTVKRSEEWYFWYVNGSAKKDPATNPNIHVLLTLDESSFAPSLPYHAHPVSWYQEFEGGRSWFSALGHYPDYYRDPFVQKHLLGGIMWAAGMTGTKVTIAVIPRYAVPAGGPVALFDLSGRKLRSFSFANPSEALRHFRDGRKDCGIGLPAGFYLMKTDYGSKQVYFR